MGETSKIEWTDDTWNPWRGCTKVSPGCDHCYMFSEQRRYGKDPEVVTRCSPQTFNSPLRWHKKLAEGERRLVFTCSWSDFFHKDADEWRDEAWDIIRRTPQLTYQILTKRPALIASRLPEDWGAGYPNVWLVTSAENQEQADRRIPVLLEVPAVVHGVSAEPMLEPIDFARWMPTHATDEHGECPHWCPACGPTEPVPRLDWIIVGGESGAGARPFDLGWARQTIQQCREAGVACFVKQLGAWPVMWPLMGQGPSAYANRCALGCAHGKCGDPSEWPEDLRVREMPEVTSA